MLCLFVINAFCGLALWFKRSHPDSIQRVGLHFRKLAGGSDEGSDGGIEESKKTLLVDGLQSKDNSREPLADPFVSQCSAGCLVLLKADYYVSEALCDAGLVYMGQRSLDEQLVTFVKRVKLPDNDTHTRVV